MKAQSEAIELPDGAGERLAGATTLYPGPIERRVFTMDAKADGAPWFRSRVLTETQRRDGKWCPLVLHSLS